MSRTKHGGYEPAPLETVRAVLVAKAAWDSGELDEAAFLAEAARLYPAPNFADFMAGREAARR